MLRVSLLFAGLLAPCVLAAAHVRTPFGKRLTSNVHPVPPGGEINIVDDEIRLLDAQGNIIHVAPNSRSPTSTASANDPTTTVGESGWVSYAYWIYDGTNPITSFTSVWEVPEAPETFSNQTVYLFNGLQPEGFAIFQPVLQYGPTWTGAGGGDYWAIASWFVSETETYFTPIIKVHPGETLTGVMQLVGTDGSGANATYNYTSEFAGIPGTLLKVTGITFLDFAANTLEIYNVTTASDLPSGTTVFRDIDIQTQTGTPNITWDIFDDPDDGILATIDIQGATGAKVTITY